MKNFQRDLLSVQNEVDMTLNVFRISPEISYDPTARFKIS
jgi:hypothetical protein